MHTEETIQVDLCPYLRYLRARVETILRECAIERRYEKPIEKLQAQLRQEAKVMEAVDLARIIANVICPLARDAQPPAFAREYHNLAERLFDLARPWGNSLDPDYPEDKNKSLLILDRIEQLENRINQLFERRAARRQERRAA